jgi:hypothetical protein
LDHLAIRRIAWHDRKPTVAKRVLRSVFQIEPQCCHLQRRPVTLEALVRENWADIPIEFDRRRERFLQGSGDGRSRLRRTLHNMH